MQELKSKDVHLAVKQDDGIEYLISRFGFENQEELFKEIWRATPGEANDLIRKLKKKAKRNSRRDKASKSAANLANEEVSFSAEQPVQEITEILNNPHEELDEELEQEEMCMSQTLNLEQLKAQEQEISLEVRKLEIAHREFVGKRLEIRSMFKKSQKALEELLRLKEVQESRVLELARQYNECADEMDSINQKIREYQPVLEDIRRQIVACQKVNILVYADCSIEVENAETPMISEEEITSDFSKLIAMPEAGELTINELKTIARLQRMVKFFESQGNVIELGIDSTKVQGFWEAVVA